MTKFTTFYRHIRSSPKLLDFLDRMRRKHPTRSSVCGLLLAEVRSSCDATDDQMYCLKMLRALRCRRGLRALEESAWSVANRIQSEECNEETLPKERDRYFVASILCAIGEIDSESSHSSLLQFYFSVRNTHLKAAVLSAMSLEHSMFDINFVVDILEQEASEPIILSGLCAVMLHLYRFDSTIWWKAVVSHLAHRSAEVRMYAIRALATTGGPETRPEIAKLLDDADPEVCKWAAWMLEWVAHKG